MTMRPFLTESRATPREQPWCPCGRDRRRPGQRTCKQCHAEDMRERRAQAVARGQYTLRGCGRRER